MLFKLKESSPLLMTVLLVFFLLCSFTPASPHPPFAPKKAPLLMLSFLESALSMQSMAFFLIFGKKTFGARRSHFKNIFFYFIYFFMAASRTGANSYRGKAPSS
jgi:hypothetical protein